MTVKTRRNFKIRVEPRECALTFVGSGADFKADYSGNGCFYRIEVSRITDRETDENRAVLDA